MSSIRAAAAAASVAVDPSEACRELLSALPAAPFTTGFLYVSDAYAPADVEDIRAHLQNQLALTSLTGMVGVGICLPGRDVFDQPALSLQVLDVSPNAMRPFRFTAPPHPLPQVYPWEAETAPVVFLHTDSRRAEALVPCGDAFFLGGLTTSRHERLQIHGEGVVDGGATGLVLSPEVRVGAARTQGCAALGEALAVTGASGATLTTLGGRPALEVLRDQWAPRSSRPSGLFVVQEKALVYEVKGWRESDGAVLLDAPIDRSQPACFARRDALAAHEDLERALRELRERAPGPPVAAVYLAALSRGPFLFEHPGEEVSIIQRALGDIPLTGAFCAAPFAGSRAHPHCGVLSVFY